MIKNWLAIILNQNEKPTTNEGSNNSKDEVKVGPPEPTLSRKRKPPLEFSNEKTPKRFKNWKKMPQNQLHIYH